MRSQTLSPSTLLRTARIVRGRSVRSEGALVLAYHDVRATPSDYHVTPDQLARQLALVRSAGMRFVPLADVVDALEAGGRVDELIAVTFDDALLGVAELAVPLLQRLDVPATVFAVAHRLGAPPDWMEGQPRTLTEPELRDLGHLPGMTVGSHAGTHRSLPTLSDAELEAELTGGRELLAARVGKPVDLLAYPFGHHDERVRRLARAAGYRAGFTFLNGRVEPGQDLFKLPRLTMGTHHSNLRLAHHLARRARSWPDTQLEAVR
jgi:peptidoglycan/xylan/chitin deacetylase (PgdA/CDA1 family)